LLDEVFGSENFVSQIVYTKTSGATTNTIGSVADYIIWYSKDITEAKIRKLFVEKNYSEVAEIYRFIELKDGQRMSIGKWESLHNKFNYQARPQGSKVYRISDLTSQTGSDSIRYPIVFEGKEYQVSTTRGWRTSKEGMERLIRNNRVIALDKSLAYVFYLDDFPVTYLNNVWTDTGTGGFLGDKLYVVQSTIKAIQRCILMTTDPGDLVLDPTCGSGTTAYVAEQWGRRWITMDTSRIALNIAKKRLTTATFPYYELYDKSDIPDIRQGFVYKTVPHITLKSIANDLEPEKEILYDQPLEDKKKLRVSGPFTVETLQSYNVISPEELDARPDEAEENRLFQERIFSHLQTNGIRNGDKTQKAVFHSMEPVSNPFLHARGYYTDAAGEERLVYFHIGPKFGTVSKRAVNEAVRTFRSSKLNEGASWLVLLGFSFEDNINDKDYNLGNFTVSKVRMHDDLMQDGLLKNDKGAGSFITIGEPDIALINNGDGTCHVEIRGLDIYDPIKDIVKPRSVEDIAYWEMDSQYDDTRFVVRSLHFCGGDKKEFDDWRKGLGTLFKASAATRKKAQDTLRLEFTDEMWESLYGFTSEPIPYEPGRKVAVRVISQFGEESSKVLTME
jgi:adenine-specific DNA-methyltransferase